MVGYTETLTDPSYRGQILCLTYPLVGNYGVPDKDVKDEFGLPKYFESDQIQIKGLLIHNLSAIASHWSCIKTLDRWLYEEKIPGIYDIDTRELTKILRINGIMKGAISVQRFSAPNSPSNESRLTSEQEREGIHATIKDYSYDAHNFMHEVSTKKSVLYRNPYSTSRNLETIVLLDTGTKYSIIRNILKMGFNVVRLPWDTAFDDIMRYNPSAVVISNGPGDPKICNKTVRTATELIKKSKPTLGICLGQQILALAGGAETYKLKFGHRGQNKPCLDLYNNMTYITSQNHGYGIAAESLERAGFKVWFSNIDDDTIEGIEHVSKPIIAVQFHPEASPGPNDCTFIFQRFKEIIINHKKTLSLDSNLQIPDTARDVDKGGRTRKPNINRKFDFASSENKYDIHLNESESEAIQNKEKLKIGRKNDTR